MASLLLALHWQHQCVTHFLPDFTQTVHVKRISKPIYYSAEIAPCWHITTGKLCWYSSNVCRTSTWKNTSKQYQLVLSNPTWSCHMRQSGQSWNMDDWASYCPTKSCHIGHALVWCFTVFHGFLVFKVWCFTVFFLPPIVSTVFLFYLSSGCITFCLPFMHFHDIHIFSCLQPSSVISIAAY